VHDVSLVEWEDSICKY